MPDPFTADSYVYVPTTFAQLPVASTVPGMRAEITDCASGITSNGLVAAGGGTTKIKVQSDGTTWRVQSGRL